MWCLRSRNAGSHECLCTFHLVAKAVKGYRTPGRFALLDASANAPAAWSAVAPFRFGFSATGIVDLTREGWPMDNGRFGIATGGEGRLWKATEARIRAKYERELSASSSRSQRAEIEAKIQRELKEEMKRIASPYSLWGLQ